MSCDIRSGSARTHPGSGIGTLPAFLVLLLAHTASAAGPESVALDSLITIALRDNPRIQALEESYLSTRERIPQAGALPDPMLNFIAERPPVDQASPTRAVRNRIGITQMFPFPGKQGLMKSAMSAEANMNLAQRDRVRLEVVADLRRAFYDLHFIHASIDVVAENLTTLKALAEVARTKYEVGTAMQQDLLKANVELAQGTNRLVVLRARVPAAEAKVNAILARPTRTALGRPSLGDTTATWPEPVLLEAEALEQQPMLRMREQAIVRGEAELRLARKAGLPDVVLGLEYMTEREMPGSWTGMLGLTLPIWRWNKVGPARRQSEHALLAAQADREQARNETLFMVRDAWTMVTTARTLVDLYRVSVLPQAEQTLASTRSAYETNRVDFLSLLDSQRALLQTRLEFEEAVTDYLKSQADLALATGDARLLGVAP